MKLPTRTTTALAAAFALTALPAGAAMAQEAGCEVVQGPGSASGDVECPPEESGGVSNEGEGRDGESGVGGETITRDDDDDEVAVLPGRIDRPADGAPAGGDTDATTDATTDAAPSIESTDAELAATGTDADVVLVAAIAALALGGGALAATRRRQRTSS